MSQEEILRKFIKRVQAMKDTDHNGEDNFASDFMLKILETVEYSRCCFLKCETEFEWFETVLHGLILVVGEGYRTGFFEKPPEASPMFNRANASSSKRNPLLAKAKPISDGGSTSGITYLRRKPQKSYCTEVIVVREEQSENICEKQPCRHPGETNQLTLVYGVGMNLSSCQLLVPEAEQICINGARLIPNLKNPKIIKKKPFYPYLIIM
ncbi:hypothetical protein DUI87_13182 [Hirundo rustica rustica]|uniref:Uncharacterized protein n=1 Tax=Hirundo rustica rustica TaxID=333673 RepID=A0A3M0KB15_HIRRU|nr:hypothetical protein DUI87_13182 [Hirundo rustica rustica]